MNRLFLLLFGMVTFVAHAQVPDYVPTDGLVAFYELENSLLDIGEGESHGSSESAQFSCETEDDGFCSLILTEESPYVNLPSSLELNGTQGGISMGGWVKLESMELSNWKLILDVTDGSANNNWGDRIQMGVIQDESGLFWNSGAHFDNDITVDYLLDTPWDIEFGRWYHFMVTYDFDGSLTHYVDGVPVNDTDVSNVGDCFLAGGNNGSRRIGARAHNQDTDLKWEGGLRSIGIWERPLAPSEVEMMFQLSSVQLIGCTDPTACNFNEAANQDDSSCIYPLFGDDCDTGGAACGEGTVWDSASQSCVAWNDCPSDLDGDGVIGVSDLMTLLADFGNPCPPAWSCGELYAYHGHDYATVQIGEQCWFAENLRTELYQNGDSIPAGAATVYGEDASCEDYSPDGDACNPVWSLNEYGRLYNWYAVDDERGLCPTGWQVPKDGEWMTLEMELGMTEAEVNSVGWRGTDQGTRMKSSYGWFNNGNGNNLSSFSSLPGGYLMNSENFIEAGENGYWWSSSPNLNSSHSWYRALHHGNTTVRRSYALHVAGFSIRCLKD